MYGLVNKAIADLVIDSHGHQTWNAILREAELDTDPVAVMDVYDDDITFGLVEAASRVLKTPADTILEQFGQHWISHVASEGWAEVLAMGGPNLRDFLSGLDRLHATVSSAMTAATMPSFNVRSSTATSIEIDYLSVRKGLAPMVTGLFIGLCAHFDEEHEVRITDSDESGDVARHTFVLTKVTALASAP